MTASADAGLAARTSIEFYFGCEFSAWGPEVGIWDGSYESRLFDPGDNQIK